MINEIEVPKNVKIKIKHIATKNNDYDLYKRTIVSVILLLVRILKYHFGSENWS